jgi:hypothetical protein
MILVVQLCLSAPPQMEEPQLSAEQVMVQDLSTFVNANYILMFVTNLGTLGNDGQEMFGTENGLYYPYSGNESFPGLKTILYSSGVWLSGKVGGEVRVATAEYRSEYVPGPISDGVPQPDNPGFRVYKIDGSSGPGETDYDQWPIDQGAPSDEFGNPALLGDQTLWAVFNDTDPTAHSGFNTDPLGIEVQQTVWASAASAEEIVLYVKYKLYNKGSNHIDSLHFGFWADPDLGVSYDDLVGCDSLTSVFFCYNDGIDSVYSPLTPVWGGKILYGPVVPSPGDSAIFDGNVWPDYRNLPMTSFARTTNGTDPQSAQDVYNYLSGLQADGDAWIDPFGDSTRLPFSGDPTTGSWRSSCFKVSG